MGFREQPNTITLRFEEGDELHGLEVTLQGMSIGEFMSSMGWDGSDGDDTAQTMEKFHKALISWNLEDAEGQPIPVSASRERPHRLILRLNNAYVDALTGVHKSDPLPEGSTSGENSPAPEIPMAPLSESQAS